MRNAVLVPLWIIAVGVIAAGLFWFRDILSQFALAMILWLAIDAFARTLDARLPFTPRWLALPLALILTVAVCAVVVVVIASNANAFTGHTGEYVGRLNALAGQLHALLRVGGPVWTVDDLAAQVNPSGLVRQIIDAVQGLASDAVFILIYLGFLFAAAAQFPQKLDVIFPDSDDRQHAREVFSSIRVSMEQYLLVQTVGSLITSALTYGTLVWIGLENALFWAFVIFFLNYIPTIGSIIAVILPTAFALVQFPDLTGVAFTAFGVAVWQFIIGNFVMPRLTGESLNLSTVVVLLALAIWTSLWGLAGAFLAAPLTVMIMIVLAQFAQTRWIAVLLSADGKPKMLRPSRPEAVE